MRARIFFSSPTAISRRAQSLAQCDQCMCPCRPNLCRPGRHCAVAAARPLTHGKQMWPWSSQLRTGNSPLAYLCSSVSPMGWRAAAVATEAGAHLCWLAQAQLCSCFNTQVPAASSRETVLVHLQGFTWRRKQLGKKKLVMLPVWSTTHHGKAGVKRRPKHQPSHWEHSMHWGTSHHGGWSYLANTLRNTCIPLPCWYCSISPQWAKCLDSFTTPSLLASPNAHTPKSSPKKLMETFVRSGFSITDPVLHLRKGSWGNSISQTNFQV